MKNDTLVTVRAGGRTALATWTPGMARKCQGLLGFSDRKCSSRETKNYLISCLHKHFIVLNLNVKYSEFICFLTMWISQVCSLKCLRRHIKAVAKCAGVPPSRTRFLGEMGRKRANVWKRPFRAWAGEVQCGKLPKDKLTAAAGAWWGSCCSILGPQAQEKNSDGRGWKRWSCIKSGMTSGFSSKI